MELAPTEERSISSSAETTPASDDLVEDLVQQTPPLLARDARVLRIPIVRRRYMGDECRLPRNLDTSLGTNSVERHPSNASSCSTLTFVTASSVSASADQWSASSGFVEDEEANMDTASHASDDFESLVEPKIESLDNDVLMDQLQEAEARRTAEVGSAPFQVKRPRGRPRKHPLPTVDALSKVAKGRSKTGCITCRRRKKKCDETKPRCLNCDKNAVICEGYPERTIWRGGSGRDKGDEAQIRKSSLPNIKLVPVIHGVETPGDRIFFEHYCFRLSTVLTVEGPRKNAFKDMLLPMAIQHLGLMHSILALSSTNIDYNEPYGRALLEKHPDLTEDILRERSQYHQDEALKEFYLDIQRQEKGIVQEGILSVRYGQMLCLVVQSIAEGKATGEHRIHLKAYQNLIRESPPDESPFMEFINEYFQFHISADEIISLPQGPARLGSVTEDWSLPSIVQPEAVRLLGVQDGLFFYMSKITSIRNTIRRNMEEGIDPVVDYTSLYRAAEIDAGIREWRPSWPEGDSRDLAGMVYKQMMWVYLWRTIYPPKTTTWMPDPKITRAVNDGIALLKLFPREDPSQTLLLAPTFIIGCAAFEKHQREPIKQSIAIIKSYTHLKNADRALEVLEQMWIYLDEKNERSWDWQTVAHSMGMDFLAT